MDGSCVNYKYFACAGHHLQSPLRSDVSGHCQGTVESLRSEESQTGLENVRILSSKTPVQIREVLCAMHNAYHDGTAETWTSLLDVAEDVMIQWEQKATSAGLTTRNSQYEQILERFLFKDKQSVTAPWNGSLNFFKITSVLNNHFNRHQIKSAVRSWCNSNMNFSDFKLNNRTGIVRAPG